MHLINFENKHLKDKNLSFIEETGIVSMRSDNDIGLNRGSYTVVKGDEIVAFVKLELLRYHSDKVEIILFETVEKGKGIGTEVLDFLKLYFVRMGLKIVYFNPTNHRVANFLIKNRFVETKRGYYHILNQY